jgi:dinuclear metal center YbgI/SA1388 family protein
MSSVEDFCDFLEACAPSRLAASWDNVGLLVGRRERSAGRVMTCLTITPESVDEAIQDQVDLVVTHHPLPFRSLKRITSESVVGALLLQLIENRTAVYSAHTAFDSSQAGINQQLAEGLGLKNIAPLERLDDAAAELGWGRQGDCRAGATLASWMQDVKKFLNIDRLRYVGESDAPLSRVAVACGSGGELVDRAIRANCDALLTGEASFHTCLTARANSMALVLPGHYASERFALETLARLLQAEFSDAEVWASRRESDPLDWV